MLMQQIADYVATQRTAQLDENVTHHTRRAIVDWFAALLAGASLAPATLMRGAFADEIGSGSAALYPEGTRASARVAAFINGTASHTAEFDDIYRDALLHPAPPIISAALATAQAVGADGRQFMRAVLAGYEVATRIGVAVSPAHYNFWHPTGTVGSFGAAAAASVLLDLDSRRTAHALATVGTFAAALQQAFRSEAMSKPVHAGRAAEAGVTAALMAREGITGALDILEGPAGFGAAMADNPDWERNFSDLGRRHNITEVTFKNHGCCGHIFASIDATLAVCRKHNLKAEDIEHIRIETYRVALDVTGRESASTPFEAKFCLRYGVASAVLFGRVRSEAFTPERVALPEIAEFIQRVDLVEDPALSKTFPSQRAARAIVTTRSGERLQYLQEHRHGDPEDPLTDQEIDDKFIELVTPVMGNAQTAKLLARLRALESATPAEIAAIGLTTR